MNKMAEEVNELLQEKESVSVAELTNIYELPSDFIQQVISKLLLKHLVIYLQLIL